VGTIQMMNVGCCKAQWSLPVVRRLEDWNRTLYVCQSVKVEHR